MQHFREQVGRVSRFRQNDPRIDADGAVGPGDCVSQAVEKNDIFRTDLQLASLIDLFGQKFTGFVHSLGGRIGEGKVVL